MYSGNLYGKPFQFNSIPFKSMYTSCIDCIEGVSDSAPLHEIVYRKMNKMSVAIRMMRCIKKYSKCHCHSTYASHSSTNPSVVSSSLTSSGYCL